MEIPDATAQFTVRFWGVRGSIPSPGPDTARYGGNTSCVSVEGFFLDGTPTVGIFDAGTGIRLLSKELVQNDKEIILFLTHTHWDHIQGFPFFAPLRQPKRCVYLSSMEQELGLFQRLLDQMDGKRFPILLEDTNACLRRFSTEMIAQQQQRGYRIKRIRANHPGMTFGFRADLRGASLVYLPDNELFPPDGDLQQTTFDEFAAFCQGADLLIHDSQYLESDLPLKYGWGHSVISQVRELAAAAQVKHLILFHHDPDRTDDDLDVIQVESNEWFRRNASQTKCTVAYEGLSITIPG